jgi:hypothetical protein
MTFPAIPALPPFYSLPPTDGFRFLRGKEIAVFASIL